MYSCTALDTITIHVVGSYVTHTHTHTHTTKMFTRCPWHDPDILDTRAELKLGDQSSLDRLCHLHILQPGGAESCPPRPKFVDHTSPTSESGVVYTLMDTCCNCNIVRKTLTLVLGLMSAVSAAEDEEYGVCVNVRQSISEALLIFQSLHDGLCCVKCVYSAGAKLQQVQTYKQHCSDVKAIQPRFFADTVDEAGNSEKLLDCGAARSPLARATRPELRRMVQGAMSSTNLSSSESEICLDVWMQVEREERLCAHAASTRVEAGHCNVPSLDIVGRARHQTGFSDARIAASGGCSLHGCGCQAVV